MNPTETTTAIHGQVSEADAVSFVHTRPRLLGIARRVLGSAADADDVVQEAWVRWQKTDRSQVHDPVAFLVATTTRLAINVGQSARVRHQTDLGPRIAEIVDRAADPVRGAEQGEALQLALTTILEKLSPTERAVYVLREAFDYPHRRIAEVVGLSEANARQLVTRARRRIAGEPRWDVDAGEHADLVEAFVAAAQSGDLARLEDLLTAGQHVGEGSHVCVAA
jgi:RNA polymerase sigma-70 factor, ECF subfamily